MSSAALIVGSGSTIGQALAELSAADFRLYGLGRQLDPRHRAIYHDWRASDYSEASFAELARSWRQDNIGFARIVICNGVLHDRHSQPEKNLAGLDGEQLQHYFRVNTIIPALAIKYFHPLIDKRQAAVIACLSAMVGSIGDNRLGGWYGYRASKAALNMIVKTAAIELARTHPETCIVAIHPGTTASPLSAPYTRNLPEHKLYSPSLSAQRIMSVLASLTPAESGRLLSWDGSRIAW